MLDRTCCVPVRNLLPHLPHHLRVSKLQQARHACWNDVFLVPECILDLRLPAARIVQMLLDRRLSAEKLTAAWRCFRLQTDVYVVLPVALLIAPVLFSHPTHSQQTNSFATLFTTIDYFLELTWLTAEELTGIQRERDPSAMAAVDKSTKLKHLCCECCWIDIAECCH